MSENSREESMMEFLDRQHNTLYEVEGRFSSVYARGQIEDRAIRRNTHHMLIESIESECLRNGIIKELTGNDIMYATGHIICSTDLHITLDMDKNTKNNTMKVLIDDHPYRIIKYLKYKFISVNEVLKYIESYTDVQRNHLIIYGYICEYLSGVKDIDFSKINKPPKFMYIYKWFSGKKYDESTEKFPLELIEIICSRDKDDMFKYYLNNIQSKITAIYAKNPTILEFYKEKTPSSIEIDYIINHDWIDGISSLLENNTIKLCKLIEHFHALHSKNMYYWNMIKDEYYTLLNTIILPVSSITNVKIMKPDLIHIKALFPKLYDDILSNTDIYIPIMMSVFNMYQLGYLLGYNIHDREPSFDECKELFIELLDIGPDKYYEKISKETKKWIVDKYGDTEGIRDESLNTEKYILVNNEDTLCEELENYSLFDIIFTELKHKEKNMVHAFTRPEYPSLYGSSGNFFTNNDKLPSNFYTRGVLHIDAIKILETRKQIKIKHNLPQSKPLRELYNIYLNSEKLYVSSDQGLKKYTLYDMIRNVYPNIIELYDIETSSININNYLNRVEANSLYGMVGVPSSVFGNVNRVDYSDVPELVDYSDMPELEDASVDYMPEL